uniref:Uncharacterized protein n=1 Tax=Arundo donax TaxID=35708 RepID=A0A0A9H9T5_ARUDO
MASPRVLSPTLVCTFVGRAPCWTECCNRIFEALFMKKPLCLRLL